MTLLVTSVLTVLVVSALCSLTEAALYAVRMPYIRQLADSGKRSGPLLTRFKQNMEQPITAILIVNTIANTAGAAVAGAQARYLFGQSSVLWFSAAFTVAVLFFSEIIPKVAGVTYNRAVAPLMSAPLNVTIAIMRPVVWISQQISRVLKPGEPHLIAPEEEVHQLAVLSAEEGSILPFEAELIRNVLQLNEVKARQIMTPRTVVSNAAANLTVKDVAEQAPSWPSRIPVYAADDPEHWQGLVLRDDVLSRLAEDRFDVTLESLSKPLAFVPETIPGHELLHKFLSQRQLLLGVVDEYGAVVGIVTLEDVMETLVGQEIMDETDVEPDLQELARRRATERHSTADGGEDEPRPQPGWFRNGRLDQS